MDPARVRQDIPLLQSDTPDAIVYLDNACVTLKPRPVIDALVEYYESYPACGERSVHRLSNRVTLAVDEARAELARLVRAPAPHQVAFTKNTTEAINQVCWGLPLNRGDVVLTSDKEHNSNLVPWLRRQEIDGVRHAAFATDPDGSFDEEAFKHAVAANRRHVKLVSVVHCSNLDGQTNPIDTIAEITHDAGARLLVDGAQQVPHAPVDVQGLDVDFYAWSVHKMLGPSGVGCLFGTEEALGALEPRWLGGNTVADTRLDGYEALDAPHSLEAGLQDYGGIIAAGAAARYLQALDPARIHDHVVGLNKRASKRLRDEGIATIQGPEDASRRAGILPFTMHGINSHDVALYLDEAAQVCIRSGAHCVHSFLNERGHEGWARASFYAYNTREEADLLVDTLVELHKAMEGVPAPAG